MIDSVPTNVLQNCTIEVINRYPKLSNENVTNIASYNRSNVVDILSDTFVKFSDVYTDTTSQIYFKEFLSGCLFSTVNRKPYELSWQLRIFWSLLFGVMLLIAISGNCIVLWIVLAHRRMRTVTNYFLLNLSISDLLMASLNCVFNFIFMIDSDWPFGYVYCIINNFIANVSVAASVFTLVAISFDRYIAIVKPLHHRTSRKKARIFLFVIWFTSCVLAAPCLIYSQISTKRYSNGKTRTVCYMLWPDGGYPTSKMDYIYNIVFLILTYAIPIFVMIFCYSLMGRELWGSRSIGEHTERQLESMKSKRKVVRMFVMIVTMFAVFWLPYHLFFIYSYHNISMASASYVQHLYLAFYFLAMSNAGVNPCIYYYMNERFRIYFQQIICCCCRLTVLKSQTRNNSPQGILLGKLSNSEIVQGKSRLARQKTLSVKWHQSMNEMKTYDKHYSVSRRIRETSLQNHPQLPKLSDSHEYISRHDSLATATTPLMVNNNALSASNNAKCDCIMPQDTVTGIIFHRTPNSYDVFGAKSDSC
ncbi:hypothetical protein ACKWTF_012541 [Chironomus riparius]